MNFLEIFKDVNVTPVMLITKVTNVKLKPATNTMQVYFTVPYELSDTEKNELSDAIKKAYGVNDVDAIYTVDIPESHPKKKQNKINFRGSEQLSRIFLIFGKRP